MNEFVARSTLIDLDAPLASAPGGRRRGPHRVTELTRTETHPGHRRRDARRAATMTSWEDR